MKQERIARAKELLKTVRHAAMATVNADGSPHNTPYFFMYDEPLKHLYWGSHPSSQHSKNIVRTGQVFVALYDGNVGGGLYLEGQNAHPVSASELDEAVRVHNAARSRFGKTPPVERAYYQQGGQTMYKADITNMWVNLRDLGPKGEHLRDYRVPVTQAELL